MIKHFPGRLLDLTDYFFSRKMRFFAITRIVLMVVFISGFSSCTVVQHRAAFLYHPLIFQVVSEQENTAELPNAILSGIENAMSVFYILFFLLIVMVVLIITQDFSKEKKVPRSFSMRTEKSVIVYKKVSHYPRCNYYTSLVKE
jgi:hypothetical protein